MENSDLMYAFSKRFFDCFAATSGLILCLPLFALIAVLIRRDSPGPIFYRSKRIGKGGRPFEMLKFRTMYLDDVREAGFVTPDDDPRITPVGRSLRRRKIDELPQLWNVLQGHMSFVGPRPQVPSLVEFYDHAAKETLKVLPGITDPASLHFIDEGSLFLGVSDPGSLYLEKVHTEKIRLSLEYLRVRGFFRDLGMVLRTLAALAKSASDHGSA